MASILDDSSVDTQVRAALEAVDDDQEPTVEHLVAAANLEHDPSPQKLEDTARWLAVVDLLVAAGLTHTQITFAMIRAATRAYETKGPEVALITKRLADDPEGLAIARAVADELLVQRSLANPLLGVAHAALTRLAAANAIEPRDEALFRWAPAELPGLRAIFASLPGDRRAALAIANAKPLAGENVNTARSAAYLVQQLIQISDLVDTPAFVRHRTALLALAATDARHGSLVEQIARPPDIETHPTTAAKRALAHTLGQRRKVDLVAAIPARAEASYARKLTIDAPELATTSAWSAAGPARRQQIVDALVVELAAYTRYECTFVELVNQVAVIDCAGERFCLVPGGAFEMGLSDDEAALVRDLAADTMRPVTTVRVGPMLVAQGPGTLGELESVAEQLVISPFRVPSEAEWEYCARGGNAHELTYRGDGIPSSEDWFHDTLDLGVETANAFGLWGFGLEPELCADRYLPTLEGLPSDGSPRRGDGPRTSRGGASQVYPWQGTGEWHMLLTAARWSSDMWTYQIAVRWVLGIDCAEHMN